MKPSPKSWIPSIPIFLLLAFVLPALAATEITPQEKKLIPLAKKEGGAVYMGGTFKDEAIRRLDAGMKKHYGLGDAFKLSSIFKGTGPTVSQARQEIRAGKFSFDVVAVASPGFYAGAADQGAFLPLESGHWKDHEERAKKAGQFFRYPYFVATLFYTFQPVWNVACPGMEGVNITSYSDILDNPKLKGKVMASDVTKSESYSLTTIGLTEAGYDMKEMWRKLKALDPVVAFRTEDKMQRIINCEQPVDLWNLPGRAYQNIREKPELAKALRWGTYKEGQVVFAHQIAVMKGAPHPNAGKLFVEFLLTKEGADIVHEEEVTYYTFLKGYKPPEHLKQYLIDFDKVKIIGFKDWVESYKKFKTMQEEWMKVFMR
ncbi:MAG: ABC transporter substrate-binding protein [Nitrospinota bacterium]